METWVHVRQVWVPVFTCTRPLLCSRNRGCLLLFGLYENPFRFCEIMSELLFSLFSRLFPHLQQEAISGSGDLRGQRLGQKKVGFASPLLCLKMLSPDRSH